jgi:hypothetical protein
MSEISMICIDSQKKLTLEKKLENYTKGTLLISEANELIEKLQNEITNMDTSKINKTNFGKVNEYIDLLSVNNPNFDEVLYIIEQFRAINSGLPVTAQINDNIEQEVIYEEHEVEQV